MLFVKNIVGWVIAHWRLVLYIAAALALVVVFGLVWRACSKPPKLDEKAIQKAQQAIAKQDREEMIKILAESDTKEDEIDSNIRVIEQAREDAKKNYNRLTNKEIEDELNRRAKE